MTAMAIWWAVAGLLVTAPGAPIRGITVSTHGDGTDWASDTIPPTLDELTELGANWVAFHPYAWIQADGEVRFQLDPASPPEHVLRPIREAHRRGLSILIKPHLGYWGSGFSWRGDITFSTAAEWSRFFATYRAWITTLAAVAADADAFAVGTELDQTIEHEAEWRAIIAEVRAVSAAALTYAANWTHYEVVPFWDALDWIGVQAYFPLVDARGPDDPALRRGWAAVATRLAEASRQHGRPVVLTELGYNRSLDAPVEPWNYRTDGAEAEELQARCLGVALAAVDAEPTIRGAFLWKWFPTPRQVGRNFQLATPRLRQVIHQAWEAGAPDR